MRTRRLGTTPQDSVLDQTDGDSSGFPAEVTSPEADQAAECRGASGASSESGATRREFLKTSVAAAISSLIAGQTAAARGRGVGSERAKSNNKGTEQRDLLFDFSGIDTDNHDLIVIAGTQRFKLKKTSAGVLKKLRKQYPVLGSVPDGNATHWLKAQFPADDWQACCVKRFERQQGTSRGRNPKEGRDWDLVMWFDHVPSFAVREAADLIRNGLDEGEAPPVHAKWAQFGLTGEDILAVDDPVGLEVLKTNQDTATAIVNKHPEFVCGDPFIKQAMDQGVIGPKTGQMGQVIGALGPSQEQTPWNGCGSPVVVNTAGTMPGFGTLIPVCNPDTGERASNTSGDCQYTVEYHPSVNSSSINVIKGSMQEIKDDPTYGTNDSNNPDQAPGVIYRYGDGTTTSDQTDDGLGAGNGLNFTTKDYSPGTGYSSEVLSVADGTDAGIIADITVKVRNWYVRYLGIFVRYYDENGNVLAVSDTPEAGAALADRFDLQAQVGKDYNTDSDYFIDVLAAEKEILGIPAGDKVTTYEIPLPAGASSFSLLASGMGTTKASTNPFDGSTPPGAVMTGVFNLSLPAFFLALGAAAGVGRMLNALRDDTQKLLEIVPLTIELFKEVGGFTGDAAAQASKFQGSSKQVGENILKQDAGDLRDFVVTYLKEGQDEAALLDAIPFVGGFMAMIQATGTLAEIAQTSAQVLNSPSTYRKDVQLTHDIDVVIKGDPKNAGSWPSTATSFKTVLLFDGGTPTALSQQLPGGTVDKQTASFKAVPFGGIVTASVQVYSATGFQVGVASVGPITNGDSSTPGLLTINVTLTELEVPLTSSTVYSHKEVIALSATGEHVWQVTTTPPTQKALGCNNVNGELCELTGITVNTTAGDVGQTFKSANSAVTDCSSGAGGQTNQFSNTGTTANPEDSYFFSGCGFNQPPRLVYDVVNDRDFNFYLDTSSRAPGYEGGIIRQVRLTKGSEGFDAPNSNKAWGKLQFRSNAFLLHPGRKIISVNSADAKIEVVELPEAHVADDDAPVSNAYGGRGVREGLMNSPVLAALAPDGTVLILESENKRIQAFDLNANPAKKFGTATEAYYFPLRTNVTIQRYVDFAVEFEGYMYVLWETSNAYTLDIYDPKGNFLASTPGFVGQRLAVNYWRDIYTQNSVALTLPGGAIPARTEPAISHWIPSTP